MTSPTIDERRRAARRGPVLAPPEELRAHHISTRVNPSELARLDQLRVQVRMQRGEFLRAAALHRLPPTAPQMNSDAWEEMARLGANLNQLTKHVNSIAAHGSSGQLAVAVHGLIDELTSAAAQIKALRAELLAPTKANGGGA